jgi:protein SCO1/2
MNDTAQRRGIWITVAALVAVMALLVGLFVQQFYNPDRLDPNWLRARGALVFDTPRPMPAAQLVDQQGEAFDGSAFAGQWDLLFFGFTFCPDICPTTMATLGRTMEALEERGAPTPQVTMVSVDPARDTPERLNDYVAFYDPTFRGLTGEFLDVHRFATSLNIAFRKAPGDDENYLVDHSAQLVLLNPQGQYMGLIKPPYEAERLAETLAAIMRTY